MLTYYDHSVGRKRFKRRYVWSLWSLLLGISLGALLVTSVLT